MLDYQQVKFGLKPDKDLDLADYNTCLDRGHIYGITVQ